MSSLSVAAPPISTPQVQSGNSSAATSNTDGRSFAHLFKEHSDSEADESSQPAKPPTALVSSKGTKDKDKSTDKDPRQKSNEQALASLLPPVSQPQLSDSRSLMLSFPTSRKGDGDEKTQTAAAIQQTAAAIQQSRTPDTAPSSRMQTAPAPPIAFGVHISAPQPAKAAVAVNTGRPVVMDKNQPLPPRETASHPQDAPPAQPEAPRTEPHKNAQNSAPAPLPKLATASEESHSTASTKNTEAGAAGPAVQKPELQSGSNGSQQQPSQQQSQHSPREKDGVASTAGSASRQPASTNEPGPGTPAPQAAPAAKIEPPAAAPVVLSPASQATTQTATASPASAAVTSTAQAAPVAEPPTMPVVRPHAIDLRVGDPANGQVDLRISQRAGDVEVTVRTPDANLAQSLRQHLPELSDRLSQGGIHSDVWQPASAQASAGDTSSHSESEGGQQWQREQSDSQRQRQDQEQANSQQDPEQQRQSSWLNAFITADKETL